MNIDCHIASNKINSPEKSVTKSEEISIFFDYPLTNPVVLSFKHKGGFTRKDFANVVHKGYKKIYKAESDPGYVKGMMNRSTSSGPYGIWGHYMEDLYE